MPVVVGNHWIQPSASRLVLNFDRPTWPHGSGGKAKPHGAVFGVQSPE